MKKLLFILALMVSAYSLAQDDTVDNLPEKTSLSGSDTEYFYLLDGTTNKHFTGEGLVNLISDSANQVRIELNNKADFLLSNIESYLLGGGYWQYKYAFNIHDGASRTLYPVSDGYYPGLFLGGAAPATFNQYMLRVNGQSYFSDSSTFASKIKLGEGYMNYNSSNMQFYDPTAGLLTLSELATFPTVIPTNHTLNTGVYDLMLVDDNDYGYQRDHSADLTKLSAGAKIELSAPVVDITDSAYIDTSGVGDITVQRTITLGGTTIDDWSDIGGVGGGVGGSYDSTEVADSPDKYVLIYDKTLDYYDTVRLEIDTTEAGYVATLPVTSTQINAGTDITIVEAPGAGKFIYLRNYIVYLEAGTAYTSGGSTNSFHYAGETSFLNIGDDNIGVNYTAETRFFGALTGFGLTTYSPVNKALMFDWDAHTTGNRDGYMKVFYEIVEE